MSCERTFITYVPLCLSLVFILVKFNMASNLIKVVLGVGLSFRDRDQSGCSFSISFEIVRVRIKTLHTNSRNCRRGLRTFTLKTI